MRKLTPDEQHALAHLKSEGSVCMGARVNSPLGQRAKVALDGLVRKKQATVEETDDGPRYHAAS